MLFSFLSFIQCEQPARCDNCADISAVSSHLLNVIIIEMFCQLFWRRRAQCTLHIANGSEKKGTKQKYEKQCTDFCTKTRNNYYCSLLQNGKAYTLKAIKCELSWMTRSKVKGKNSKWKNKNIYVDVCDSM